MRDFESRQATNISFDDMPKVLADIQKNIQEFSAKLEEKVTDPDRLYTTKEAAEFLNISTHTLDQMRFYKRGVPFVRVGEKTVRYRKRDLIEYINNNLVNK